MCAGGGCMDQISNEKFGLFVTELRKEKNLTQKDLAEKLYVSDKTVSKWERGLSMPNVVLLIPIADILDVTVTELLRGEKIDRQKNIDTKEVEELVVGSLDMAVRNSIHQHRKNWILAYLLCLFISITEIIILVVSGISSLNAFLIKASVLVSTALVESSRIRILGFLRSALAIHNLCFCPPDTLVPPCSIYVLYFLGNVWTNGSACASSQACIISSSVASLLPQRKFSLIVPENNTFF